MYFSASTKGFYDETIHGQVNINIADPAWVRPTIEIPDPNFKGEGDAPLILVADDTISHPTISVKNPACKIPDDAVEIDQVTYKALMEGQSAGKIIVSDSDGHPVLQEPELPLLADIKGAALIMVDHQAEQARLKFITPGAAQAMVYQRKVQEAETLEFDTSPDEQRYPLLAAEINITGGTLQEVAETVLAQRDIWLSVAALIEQRRLLTKNLIKVVVDAGEVRAVIDDLEWPQPEQD